MIVIDQERAHQGGRTNLGGSEYVGGGLEAGECGLKINSVKKDDLGQWSCSLVTTGGQIFGGHVNVVGEADSEYHQPIPWSKSKYSVEVLQRRRCLFTSPRGWMESRPIGPKLHGSPQRYS